MLGSFKVKLVSRFLALSLLALATAYWSFSAVADRTVTNGVDARLEAGLRAAVAAYDDERREAEQAALRLAREPGVPACRCPARSRRARQPSCATRRCSVSRRPTASGSGAPRRSSPSPASPSSARTHARPRSLAGVPLDRALLRRLHTRSGMRSPGRGGPRRRATTASGPRRATASAATFRSRPTAPRRPRIATRSYRAVGVELVPEPMLTLAVVSPTSTIAAEQASIRTRLLGALAASIILIGLVAYFAARSIVNVLGRLAGAANSIAAGNLRERVPVRGRDEFAALGAAFNQMAADLEARLNDLEDERQRLREANSRFGDALAATLDRRAAPPRHRRVGRRGDACGRRPAAGRGRLGHHGRRHVGRAAAARVRAEHRPDELRHADPARRRTSTTTPRSPPRRSPARPWSRSRTPGFTRSSSARRSSTCSPGLANRRQGEEALVAELARARAARRLGRADPRRPGRLQVDQRPLRAPDRRPRPARVRRHAARDPARDRRGRALGRRGVRRRPARHAISRGRRRSRIASAARSPTARSPRSTAT